MHVFAGTRRSFAYESTVPFHMATASIYIMLWLHLNSYAALTEKPHVCRSLAAMDHLYPHTAWQRYVDLQGYVLHC